jgi:hypothetical protein
VPMAATTYPRAVRGPVTASAREDTSMILTA